MVAVGRVGQWASTSRRGRAFDFLAGVLDSRFTFTRASNATAFDSTGSIVTVGTDEPRFDVNPETLAPRGLLQEGARTNSLRNSGNGGVTVGTIGAGGALPTNWNNFRSGGVDIILVGTGTENGMAYTDIRFSGTATVTGNTTVFFESSTQVVAASGQTWTGSVYITRIAGSETNLNSQTHFVSGRNSAGSSLEEVTTSIAGVATPLNRSRVSSTITLANALSVFSLNGFRINVTSGNAVDVTYRVAFPQLEQGAFASSYIPTTSGAATRAADNPRIEGVSYTSLFNSAITQGALVAEFTTMNVPSSAEIIAEFSDGTFNNRIFLNKNTAQFGLWSGGVSQVDLQPTPTYVAGSTYRAAIAWQLNNAATSFNGATALTDTSCTMPAALDRLELGQKSGSVNFFGWLRRLSFFPQRLPDAQLQALSA